jgi:hypothetical protein
MIDVNFTTGMVLNGMKLFPNEVAIQVTCMWGPRHWIGEMSCPTLGEGLGHVIQWKRRSISSILRGQGLSIGTNNYHYHRNTNNALLSPDVSCASAAYDYPPSTPSPIGTVACTAHSLSTVSPKPPSVPPYLSHPSNTSISISSLSFVDGLGVYSVVRAYRMVHQTQK